MGTSDGRILSTTKVVNHGSADTRWNLVILGDGYQESEINKYRTDVNSFISSLQNEPPFDEDDIWQTINIYRVDVASNESGADDPKEPATCGGTGNTANTYFDATFCFDNVNRRLLSVNQTTALMVAIDEVPEVHQVLVIVNSPIYGGAGGVVGVFSTHPSANEIALHELGHSAFGLADEYEYFRGCNSGETDRNRYSGSEPIEPNVTTNSDRTTIKWRNLISSTTSVPTTENADCSRCDPQPNPVSGDTVGAFEGARYFHCGLYRPVFNCKMRSLNQPFCPVCRQAIREVFEQFTLNGIYTIQQKSNGRFLDAHEISSKDFTVVTRNQQRNDTQRWIIKPLGNNIFTIQQKSNDRFLDAHEISSKDFTVVTRNQQRNDTQRWIIKPLDNNIFTIQQKSNGRFLDAHEISSKDFTVVTRNQQRNDTQRWIVKPL